MTKIKAKLIVLFEDSFWYGIYEREYDEVYDVCKIVFGSEPKDYEVYEYLLKNNNKLKFYNQIKSEAYSERRINPKRRQRKIKKQIEQSGFGTKAQQALKLQYENIKREKKSKKKLVKESEKEYKFMLKQEKRKAKHRGH